MHSHLIPGIDDGAPDLETSLTLIKAMHAMGFRRLITTPHIMADLYPNTPAIINSGLDRVRRAVNKAGIDVQIDAAAEYLLDEGFAEKMEQGNLLTMGDRYVLVELSFVSAPPNLYELLFQLQTKGYRPILAHPERYGYLGRDMKAFEQLIDRGCLLQVNLGSLAGYYGRDIRQVAINLLKAGLIALAGSDLHHDRHRQMLSQLLQDRKVARYLKDYAWQNATLFSAPAATA